MKIKIFYLLLFIGNLCYSQGNVNVSILTCSPGDEIYSIFGHSAIRILDKDKKMDKIYDFGTFDFNIPNFEYKFLHGKAKCNLSQRKANLFVDSYSSQNRLIVEQKLNLTDSIKSILLERLNDLHKPENRSHYYTFLKSNCSTDLRDLLIFVGVKFPDYQFNKSNRDLINKCLEEKKWLKLGINTLSGFKIDRKTDSFQSMFLPVHLKNEINNSYINNIKLVKSERNLNRVKPSIKPIINMIVSPFNIFLILLLFYLFRIQKAIEITLIPLIGLCGLLITSLCVFSVHEEFQSNLNILWCNPLYLLYPLVPPKKKINSILTVITSLSLVICAIIWALDIQKFDVAIIPIMIILGLVNFKRLKKTSYYLNRLTRKT